MRSRREFVAASACTTAVLFAGCNDVLGESDDSGGSDPSTESDDSDDTSGESDRAQRQEIVDLFESGQESHNEGTEHMNDSVSAYNSDYWGSAEMEAQQAQDSFESAENDFSDAVAITYEVENAEAREIVEDAEERVAILKQAAQYSEEAAEFGSEENFSQADSRSSTANELVNDAQQINLRDVSTLENVLDL